MRVLEKIFFIIIFMCIIFIPQYHVNLISDGKTYADVLQFLKEDQTNTLIYIDDIFDCTQFTQTLIDNARAQGFIVSAVEIYWNKEGDAHDIAAFMTSDKGIIWIEPQDDTQYDLNFPNGKLCSITNSNDCWDTPVYAYQYLFIAP